MSPKLSIEIQLGILEEVNQKSDGKTPVVFDLIDDEKILNFDALADDGCFLYFSDDRPQQVNQPQKLVTRTHTQFHRTSVAKLSHKGHERMYELEEQIKDREFRQEEINLLRKQVDALCKQVDLLNEASRQSTAQAERAICIAQGANNRYTAAMLIVVVCACIAAGVFPAIVSLLFSICSFCSW